jgi:hypothetical protein
MERLFKLTREELIQLAMTIKNTTDAQVFDPFSNEALRYLIIEAAVSSILDTHS